MPKHAGCEVNEAQEVSNVLMLKPFQNHRDGMFKVTVAATPSRPTGFRFPLPPGRIHP